MLLHAVLFQTRACGEVMVGRAVSRTMIIWGLHNIGDIFL